MDENAMTLEAMAFSPLFIGEVSLTPVKTHRVGQDHPFSPLFIGEVSLT